MQNVILGFIAGVVGINLVAINTKTKFQKELEKNIIVYESEKNMDSICGGDPCPEGKHNNG